ncbi:ATP-binding cassette domain-containing protein [Asticcacaulis sp. EMRT-3]|uniref:ATP-binding cassette domain-containing protein n=1 Tax=Asticcacaulis sp. EMRT-3 TaxID=3040349 RepID=UPI0024AED10F|nr:ATP-binding cassette domain-containing protein [Asticcacaulis sp. EMRT-3]MDI7773939.1 ATP-binding cassette domain-containing protein [Asticcacaulis sp. EMRT-3]
MNDDFNSRYQALIKPFGPRLWLTALFAAGVSVSAVALLGLSGWFLTAAAVAGAAGPVLAQTFNYLLPSAFIRFFAISRTVLRYGERYLGHSAALRAMADLRPALFKRLLDQDRTHVLALSRGESSSRFVQDVGSLETALVMQSAPASALGGIGMAALMCAWANPWGALILLVFMAAILAATLYIHRLVPANQAEAGGEQAAIGALKARFYELMALLPDIRAYDLRQPLLDELRQLEARLYAAKTDTIGREALSGAVSLILSGLCLITLIVSDIHVHLADLALSLLAASMGFESLGVLAKAIGQRSVFKEARSRVASLYDSAQSRQTAPLPEAPYLKANGLFYHLDTALRLRIDGPSGSGKTRLIEALIGLREGGPEGVYDGSLFALCPQDAALLTGSLRDNLLMALNEAAFKRFSRAEIETQLWAALDDAALAERVRSLPKGLDSWVGDGGVTLSGGERKRLALARALLREAPILLLDEPTEGLDLATEAKVVARLEARLRDRKQGLILISHRLAPRALTGQCLAVQAP